MICNNGDVNKILYCIVVLSKCILGCSLDVRKKKKKKSNVFTFIR